MTSDGATHLARDDTRDVFDAATVGGLGRTCESQLSSRESSCVTSTLTTSMFVSEFLESNSLSADRPPVLSRVRARDGRCPVLTSSERDSERVDAVLTSATSFTLFLSFVSGCVKSSSRRMSLTPTSLATGDAGALGILWMTRFSADNTTISGVPGLLSSSAVTSRFSVEALSVSVLTSRYLLGSSVLRRRSESGRSALSDAARSRVGDFMRRTSLLLRVRRAPVGRCGNARVA